MFGKKSKSSWENHGEKSRRNWKRIFRTRFGGTLENIPKEVSERTTSAEISAGILGQIPSETPEVILRSEFLNKFMDNPRMKF